MFSTSVTCMGENLEQIPSVFASQGYVSFWASVRKGYSVTCDTFCESLSVSPHNNRQWCACIKESLTVACTPTCLSGFSLDLVWWNMGLHWTLHFWWSLCGHDPLWGSQGHKKKPFEPVTLESAVLMIFGMLLGIVFLIKLVLTWSHLMNILEREPYQLTKTILWIKFNHGLYLDICELIFFQAWYNEKYHWNVQFDSS